MKLAIKKEIKRDKPKKRVYDSDERSIWFK